MKFKRFFGKYWWILPALIAVAGMIVGSLPYVDFSRNTKLFFLVSSVIAGLGWFTREKDHQEKPKDTTASNSQIEEQSPESDKNEKE